MASTYETSSNPEDDEMPKATPKRQPQKPSAFSASVRPVTLTKNWGAWSKKKHANWGTEDGEESKDNDWKAPKKRKADTADAEETFSWKADKQDSWKADKQDSWKADKQDSWKADKQDSWKADKQDSWKAEKQDSWKADTTKGSKDNDWKASDWKSSDWSWKNDWKEASEEKVAVPKEESKPEPQQNPPVPSLAPSNRQNPSRLPDKADDWADRALQKRLFPGLPPLPLGWTRCCTRSMPHQMYYYHKQTCVTTFEIAEVIKPRKHS